MKKLAFSIVAALLLVCACVEPVQAQVNNTLKYKKALFVGAHPDDPETCAGGTMILMKQMGCDVVSVYLTGGESGIKGKTHDEAAAIRRIESADACKVMGVRSLWVGQIDGYTEVNRERYAQMKAIIEAEKPDVVFTHWPIDSHRDHRACSLLVYDAWRQLDHSFELYYFEAMTGLQSMNFTPDEYVDISSTVDLKHEAIMCHRTQEPEWMLNEWHIPMEKMRGNEFQCKAAEAFIHQRWRTSELFK